MPAHPSFYCKRKVYDECGLYDTDLKTSSDFEMMVRLLYMKKIKAEYLGRYVFESNIERELVYVFRTIYDGVINPSAEELDGGRFWSKEDIAACIGKGVFTPNFEGEYQRFFV